VGGSGYVQGEDGKTLADVQDGLGDEHAGLHEACWQQAGSPDCFSGLEYVANTSGYRELAQVYHSQCFEFALLAENMGEWMLDDPMLDSDASLRNSDRIQRLLDASPSQEVNAEEKSDLNRV